MQITNFHINNFRSLVDVSIKKFDKITIFFGENNTGKSNILAALDLIFRRKIPYDPVKTVREDVTAPEGKPKNFWSGKIEPFVDNFYYDTKENIDFSIILDVDPVEIKSAHDAISLLDEKLKFQKVNLKISGYIKYINDNAATIHLSSVSLNKHKIFDPSVKSVFFPKLKDVESDKKTKYFDLLMEPFNDCFKLVSCGRTINDEGYDTKIVKELTPTNFKSWLHSLDLVKELKPQFKEIKDLIQSDPFSMGEISFAVNEKNQLDIMVAKNGKILPIGRLGSGWQQIIFIIANVVNSQRKIIGIEELEQNMSPESQLAIIDKLKSITEKENTPLNQLLITSHSPTFANAKYGDIYYVTKPDLVTEVQLYDPSKKETLIKHFTPSFGPFVDSFKQVKKLTEERFRM